MKSGYLRRLHGHSSTIWRPTGVNVIWLSDEVNSVVKALSCGPFALLRLVGNVTMLSRTEENMKNRTFNRFGVVPREEWTTGLPTGCGTVLKNNVPVWLAYGALKRNSLQQTSPWSTCKHILLVGTWYTPARTKRHATQLLLNRFTKMSAFSALYSKWICLFHTRWNSRCRKSLIAWFIILFAANGNGNWEGQKWPSTEHPGVPSRKRQTNCFSQNRTPSPIGLN